MSWYNVGKHLIITVSKLSSTTIGPVWLNVNVITGGICTAQYIYKWMKPAVTVEYDDVTDIDNITEDDWINIDTIKNTGLLTLPRIRFKFPSMYNIMERVLITLVTDVPEYAIMNPAIMNIILLYIL